MLVSSTLLFLAWYSFVDAGSSRKGDPCNQANNTLQSGTYQFTSGCDSQTYCAGNGTCLAKGCRINDFPFGYSQDDPGIPPKCPHGHFCPDEEDKCIPWLPVNSPCQLNRDGKNCLVASMRLPCYIYYVYRSVRTTTQLRPTCRYQRQRTQCQRLRLS